MISFYLFMNKILVIVELEQYVYNKWFGLYSILYNNYQNK